MLSNIKVKFLNVSKNVKFLQNEKIKEQNRVNFNAGTEILDHFKQEWEIMHETNESNARRAAEVADKIEKIFNDVTKKKQNAEIISEILTNSNLISNINGIGRQMGELFKLCDSVESSLIELEDTIDEIEFQNMKKQHEYHLKKYEERKRDSLRILDLELQEKKKQELMQEEMEKSRRMEERQKVFQEAFRTDLELFKSLGQIPRLELNRKQPSALLEEIQLDFDEKELDQFFEDN